MLSSWYSVLCKFSKLVLCEYFFFSFHFLCVLLHAERVVMFKVMTRFHYSFHDDDGFGGLIEGCSLWDTYLR